MRRHCAGLEPLGLTCDPSALEGCKGTLTLLTAKTVKIGGVKVQALLASAKYSLNAGATRNVTVKLPSVAKRLAKNRTLKVKAQAISKDVTFADNGNIEAQGIFLFEVKDGKITLLAATDDL